MVYATEKVPFILRSRVYTHKSRGRTCRQCREEEEEEEKEEEEEERRIHV